MKLFIEVEFKAELSERAQREVKNEIQDLRETFDYLGGTLTRADLITEPIQQSSEGPTP